MTFWQSIKSFFQEKPTIAVLSVAGASVVVGTVVWFLNKTSAYNPQKYWNTKYKQKSQDFLFGKNPRKWLVEQELRLTTLSKQNAPRLLQVLDVGAGEGQNAIWILEKMNQQQTDAQRSAFSVTAVDVSEVALQVCETNVRTKVGREIANKYFKTLRQDVLQEDLEQNKYDVIICLFTQFTEDHAKLHKKLSNALRPGGYLILQGFRPKQLENKSFGPGKKEQLYVSIVYLQNSRYDADDLRREFGRDLLLIELKEHDEEMHDGIHNGMAYLVSMVATKSSASLTY